jgi:hypothetical protein
MVVVLDVVLVVDGVAAVDVVVVDDDVVDVVAQPLGPHASQQLVKAPTQASPPAGATQSVTSRFTLQRVVPAALVRQQVTKPCFPQVERAAQRITAPLHWRGRRPARIAASALVTTQWT